MTQNNSKLSFEYIPPEKTKDNEEVGDSILIQEESIVIIEVKSRQFKEGFKYTGQWEEDSQFIDELIKKASGQIQVAGEKIMSEEITLPIETKKIRRIYPVILTYEPTPTHGKMQRYTRQKAKEFGLLQDSIFAPLEIMDINDIEKIMDCVDTYTLIDLLKEKHSDDIHSNETNFHNFFSYFLGNHKVISNGWQKTQFDELWNNVFKKHLVFKS